MSAAITLTDRDLAQLTSLAAAHGHRHGALDLLDAELARADVVPARAIAPDVVTMHSRVVVEEEQTGLQREVTLVYPAEANVDEGRLSVLAPLGSALLGLAVGQSIDWPLPGGRVKRFRIVAVPYQPEAAGDYHL